MTYLLDTNTCIAAMRKQQAALTAVLRTDPGELAVAVMTVAELWFGARKSEDPARGRAIADAFLAPFAWLPFDAEAAERYASTRFALQARGTPIGERDLIIAATALAHGLTVVTNNTREFARVPGLAVEDWSG